MENGEIGWDKLVALSCYFTHPFFWSYACFQLDRKIIPSSHIWSTHRSIAPQHHRSFLERDRDKRKILLMTTGETNEQRVYKTDDDHILQGGLPSHFRIIVSRPVSSSLQTWIRKCFDTWHHMARTYFEATLPFLSHSHGYFRQEHCRGASLAMCCHETKRLNHVVHLHPCLSMLLRLRAELAERALYDTGKLSCHLLRRYRRIKIRTIALRATGQMLFEWSEF